MTTVARPTMIKDRANEEKQDSQLLVVLRRFRRHKLAVISLILVLFIFVVSLLAPVLAPFPRDAIDISSPVRPAPPGTRDSQGQLHILGTDHLGRDLFTRLLYAARVSMSIAILVVLISETFGAFLGAMAGYFGGTVDSVISRVIEFMLTIPTLPILLIISAILLRRDVVLPLPGFVNKFLSGLLLAPEREAQKVVVLVLVLVIFGWLGAARLMRGMALSLSKQDFVEALPRDRCVASPHHLPPHHPQRHRADPGQCQPGVGRCDRDGIRAELPGSGGPGSDADLGQHALEFAELHVSEPVAAAGSGHPAGDRVYWVQFHRRRPARCAGSAVETIDTSEYEPLHAASLREA